MAMLHKNPADGALFVRLEKRARCVGECGRWIQVGETAWSYLPSPVDGNYVECGPCRYGTASASAAGRATFRCKGV